MISACQTLGRRRRLCGIAQKPSSNFVVIRLLAPEQSGEGLPLRQTSVIAHLLLRATLIKLVRLFDTLIECRFELCAEKIARRWFIFAGWRERRLVRQAQTNGNAGARLELNRIMRRHFRTRLRRVYGVFLAVDDVIVDAVLHVRSLILVIE